VRVNGSRCHQNGVGAQSLDSNRLAVRRIVVIGGKKAEYRGTVRAERRRRGPAGVRGVRRHGWGAKRTGLADLIRPDLETDQRVGPEGVGDWHVGCIAAKSDQHTADKAVDRVDPRANRNVFAEHAHLLGAVDDLAPERCAFLALTIRPATEPANATSSMCRTWQTRTSLRFTIFAKETRR